MSSYAAHFLDDNGTDRLDGTLVFANAANQPISAATVWVTVTTSAPTTYVSPLVFDSTGTTGGLYAWDGAAYQKVGLATT
jgi:hypothetical protein